MINCSFFGSLYNTSILCESTLHVVYNNLLSTNAPRKEYGIWGWVNIKAVNNNGMNDPRAFWWLVIWTNYTNQINVPIKTMFVYSCMRNYGKEMRMLYNGYPHDDTKKSMNLLILRSSTHTYNVSKCYCTIYNTKRVLKFTYSL